MRKARQAWIASLERGDRIKVIRSIPGWGSDPEPGEVIKLSDVSELQESPEFGVCRMANAWWEGYEEGLTLDLATCAGPLEAEHEASVGGPEKAQWLLSIEEGDRVWLTNQETEERKAMMVEDVNHSTIVLDSDSVHNRYTGESAGPLVLDPVKAERDWVGDYNARIKARALKNVNWEDVDADVLEEVRRLLDLDFEGTLE